MAIDLQSLVNAKQRALAVPTLPARLAVQVKDFFSQLAQTGNLEVQVVAFRLTHTDFQVTLADVPTRVLAFFVWADHPGDEINFALGTSNFGNPLVACYLEPPSEIEAVEMGMTWPTGAIPELNVDLIVASTDPSLSVPLLPMHGFVIIVPT